MTGAYLRVKRNGEYVPIEVEHLTDSEREQILANDDRIIQWLHLTCHKLAEAQRLLDDLVADGILEKAV